MRSKAHIKGHPLHPILVSFPIAFLMAAFLLDILSLFTSTKNFGQSAVYAEFAGLIFSLLAAIPGIIDYYYTVPQKSSAKKRAATHGLTNGTMALLFLTAFLLRLNTEVSLIIITCIEGAGAVLMIIAGWLGGTLVVRNQIGIDHRYAAAGKWQEEKIITSGNSIELKNIGSLKLNQMKLLHVNDKRIAIARTEAGLIAFDDRCSHRGGSLADGAMICETVQCPWHGSQFNVETGDVKAGPAKEKISTYKLKQEGNTVFLQL